MKSFRFQLVLVACAAWALSGSAATSPDAAIVRHPGKFAWVDLVTTDPAAAINFYTKLFGWTTREIHGTRERYTLLLNAGQPVAGVAYRKADAGSKAPAGARWVGSISVPDLPEAVRAVTAAGGRVLIAPRLIVGRGWQALVADPEGCVFGLIVRDGGDPADDDTVDNDWVWAQLLSGQPAAAAAFYERALGYAVAADTRAKRPGSFLLSREGVACAGLTPLPDEPGARPGWLGYIQVPETPAAVDAAKALGARVLFAQDQPDKLQLAIIADPLGGAIGLVSTPAQPATEEAK
jgi:predicted enzyme related to lactoylglutathione lyase